MGYGEKVDSNKCKCQVWLLQCYCNIVTTDYIKMVYFISFQIMYI